MTTRSSPNSSTTSRATATLRMPVGVVTRRSPCASLDSGTPNSMIPPMPASTQRRAPPRRASRGCAGRPRASPRWPPARRCPRGRRQAARGRPGAAGSRRRAGAAPGYAAAAAAGAPARRPGGRPALTGGGYSTCAPMAAARPDPPTPPRPQGRGRGRRARPRAQSADASEASTSTRSPCSSAVLAVAGPMQAITVEVCGLPAMPTRLRTVELEVKTTASNWPALDRLTDRCGRRGGPDGPVGRDVVDLPAHLAQPGDEGVGRDVGARQEDPVDRVEDLVELRPLGEQPGRGLLTGRHEVGVDAPLAQRGGGHPTDGGDLEPGEGPGVEPELLEALADGTDGVDRGEADPLVAPGHQALDRTLHLLRACAAARPRWSGRRSTVAP